MTNTELMNVNAFENQVPDAAFAGLNPQDESLADGIGQSYGVVGYRGKVWSLRYRGENYTFTRPDDGSPAAFLDVIVLRSASYRSKSWYEGGYTEGITGQRPTCSSLDGVQPDHDAMKPQAPACAICQKNEFKTNANGRKGKDCSDYKRLAVLILPSQSARLFGGQPLMEPVFLRVPAASLNDLAMLGEAMTKKGFHYATYITRIGFDVEKPHPQMTFRALQKLTDKEAPIVIQLREDPQAYRITGENEVGKAKSAPAQQSVVAQVRPTQQSVQQSPAPAQSDPGPGFVPQPEVKEEDEVTKLKRQLAEAQARATPGLRTVASNEIVDAGFAAASNVTVIPPKEKPTSNGVDTGFGTVGLGVNQPVVEVDQGTSPLAPGSNVNATTSNTDTGPAEESDADLDAKVASLLQR